MTIDTYPATRHRRDVESSVKIILDSLQASNVYDNDYQIRRLQIERHSVLPKGSIPFIRVTIEIDMPMLLC